MKSAQEPIEIPMCSGDDRKENLYRSKRRKQRAEDSFSSLPSFPSVEIPNARFRFDGVQLVSIVSRYRLANLRLGVFIPIVFASVSNEHRSVILNLADQVTAFHATSNSA